MKKLDKIKLSDQISRDLQSRSVVLVCGRSGLTAGESQLFRLNMSRAGSSVKVVRNKSILKSLEGTNIESIGKYLCNERLVVVSDDPVNTSKALCGFNDKIKCHGGIIGSYHVSADVIADLAKFDSSLSLKLSPAMFLLSQLSYIIIALEVNSEKGGNMSMNLVKEKIDASMVQHGVANDEKIKSAVEGLASLTQIQALYVKKILFDVFGVDPSAMQVASGSAAQDTKEEVSQESDDDEVIVTLSSVEGVNKLGAVRVLRAAFDLKPAEALNLLKGPGDLAKPMKRSDAKNLINDLKTNNVIATIKN